MTEVKISASTPAAHSRCIIVMYKETLEGARASQAMQKTGKDHMYRDLRPSNAHSQSHCCFKPLPLAMICTSPEALGDGICQADASIVLPREQG